MPTTAQLADQFAKARENMVSPELWEATVEYSDGSLARTDFFIPGPATEDQAKQRAWTIWRLAKAGSDGSFLNPTLKVRLVAYDAEHVGRRVAA